MQESRYLLHIQISKWSPGDVEGLAQGQHTALTTGPYCLSVGGAQASGISTQGLPRAAATGSPSCIWTLRRTWGEFPRLVRKGAHQEEMSPQEPHGVEAEEVMLDSES